MQAQVDGDADAEMTDADSDAGVHVHGRTVPSSSLKSCCAADDEGGGEDGDEDKVEMTDADGLTRGAGESDTEVDETATEVGDEEKEEKEEVDEDEDEEEEGEEHDELPYSSSPSRKRQKKDSSNYDPINLHDAITRRLASLNHEISKHAHSLTRVALEDLTALRQDFEALLARVPPGVLSRKEGMKEWFLEKMSTEVGGLLGDAARADKERREMRGKGEGERILRTFLQVLKVWELTAETVDLGEEEEEEGEEENDQMTDGLSSPHAAGGADSGREEEDGTGAESEPNEEDDDDDEGEEDEYEEDEYEEEGYEEDIEDEGEEEDSLSPSSYLPFSTTIHALLTRFIPLLECIENSRVYDLVIDKAIYVESIRRQLEWIQYRYPPDADRWEELEEEKREMKILQSAMAQLQALLVKIEKKVRETDGKRNGEAYGYVVLELIEKAEKEWDGVENMLKYGMWEG